MWFAILTTALCLVVGFPVAIAITFSSDKTKAWLLLLIMLPFWTNLLIRTYALMAVLRTEGYINFALGFLWSGLSHVTALAGHPLGAFQPLPLLHNNFAVVFGLVYVQLPFMVLPLYAALDRLDRSLLEASLDLGAGHFTTFARVVVPLAIPGIISGVLVTLIPSIGAYLTPDLLGGPDSQMIANVIERQFRSADDWPFGAALSFLLMYMTFVAIALQAVVSRRRGRGGGMTARAMKRFARAAGISTALAAAGVAARGRRVPLCAPGHPDGVQLQRQQAEHRLARLHAEILRGDLRRFRPDHRVRQLADHRGGIDRR